MVLFLAVILRASKPVTNDVPIAPPIPPPIACNPAQPRTPPIALNAEPVMKNVPIIKPAKDAEKIEIVIMLAAVYVFLLNVLPYPEAAVVRSKNILAAVNPKKWYGFGAIAKLMRVAMMPIIVIAPIFLIHQAASTSREKPIISQKNGKWDMLKKIGAKMEFRIPHSVAHIAIAAISRLLK